MSSVLGKLLGAIVEHTPGVMRVINASERALLANAGKVQADMHAEAKGELQERKHVCQWLIAKGHADLAMSIAREEHWK